MFFTPVGIILERVASSDPCRGGQGGAAADHVGGFLGHHDDVTFKPKFSDNLNL